MPDNAAGGSAEVSAVQALGLDHVVLMTNDLAGQMSYFRDVLGLTVTNHSAESVDFVSPSGTEAVRLSAGAATGCTGLAFHISPALTATVVVRRLSSYSIRAEVCSAPYSGVEESVRFTDPNGYRVELLIGRRLSPPGKVSGVSPLRLGHIAFAVADPLKTSRFYQDVLGFKVSDWVGDAFVFMRCGHEHHTVNFLKAPSAESTGVARVHHVAFEMRDAAALTAAGDVLSRAGLPIMWGPVRHGPGHNIATYHQSPGGPVIELYAEMDVMTREELGYYDPRPWHSDRPQRPKVWSTAAPRDIWGPPPSESFVSLGR